MRFYNRRFRHFVLFVPLLLLFMVSVDTFCQTVIYVSNGGNDSNAGSADSPFKSLNKAVRTASELEGEDVAVFLQKGTYYLDEEVTIESTEFKARSLEITANKADRVVVSAGRRLELQWISDKNGIYKAKVPDNVTFERLYINGRLQVMARYPNYDSSARVFNGTSVDALSSERIKRWQNPAGGYIHSLHGNGWGSLHYLIEGKDEKGNLRLRGGWQNNRPTDMNVKYRFVENIFEELDVPHEWWFDKENHWLYYIPDESVNMNDAVVEVSRFKNTISLKGTIDRPLKNIRISNLTFRHNERTFMDTREPLLRSDWRIFRGGTLLLSGTEKCVISQCIFDGIGGNAVMLSDYNRLDTISGCYIHDIGANAVSLVGDTGAVRSPSFNYDSFLPYSLLDKTPGPLSQNFPDDCVVKDNLIHDIGVIEKQSAGVEIDIASSIVVSHNSIYNTPRAGINVGDGCFGGHIIELNDVFNTVRETEDHGAFNSWGRDRYWSSDRKYMDSLLAIHPELILLDAQKQTVIRNNRFQCDHGWDIDLDDGSSNYYIYNNLCLTGGIKLREGFDRTVENNIMVNNSFHPHVWFAKSGDVFMRNVVMKDYAPIQISDWGKTVDYNFFPESEALVAALRRGTDQHSVAGDPGFADPENGDYRLAEGSDAFRTGFENFPMDQFGVKDPYLKELAETPLFPRLLFAGELSDKTVVIDFLGGKIRSVDGLGDRSAYGLPDETGVIVISAGGQHLADSGLRDGDVIRAIDDEAVENVKQFLEAYNASSWKRQVVLQIMRNQRLLHVTLERK